MLTEPERIERQLQCFLMQPDNVCAVYSDMLVVDAEGRRQAQSYLELRLGAETPPQGNLFVRLLSGSFMPAPCVMVRRNAIVAVGGYDESLFFEDLDMWLRLSLGFGFVYLPGQLVRYRMHPDSMSNAPHNWISMRRSNARILEKWLDAGLADDQRSAVLDGVFWNGAMQLRVQDPVGARLSFAALMVDPRPGRRWLARLGGLPGASAVIRFFLPVYRLLRDFAGRSAP